jgi:c-di-GMP-binding flagellar brake protein YcgR
MTPDPANAKGYSDIFDIIRPRSESPEWMIWVFVGFMALFFGLIYGGMVLQRRREKRYLNGAFNRIAVEEGLTEEEEKVLKRLAETLPNPLIIFSSITAFESALEQHLARLSGDHDREARYMLLLAPIRHKLGFDNRPVGLPLRSSRDIASGQRLQVGVKIDGEARFCTCVTVESSHEGLLISPLLRADEEVFREASPDDTLYVRFWRRGDTEYQFRSHLLPESDPDRSTLLLAHTESLKRIQKRDFYRLSVALPITLYPLPDEETALASPDDMRLPPELTDKISVTLVNLSAGGMAVKGNDELIPGAYFLIDPLKTGRFSLANISCKVLRSETRADGDYIHHFEYSNVNGRLQDRLALEIHQLQMVHR